jgi:acetolactate synthase-1/2/3 large subunit
VRVADAVVDRLARAGVRRAYLVPGESFLPLIDAIDRHPELTLISTRHESGAAFMADGDAKVTGVPAVTLATRAVGAANLAIGVHTARQDSTPMIVLLGQVETPLLGREAFQEVDLPTFYGEITKWSATATSADRLPELTATAIERATEGRPGPVMLAIPADLLEGDHQVPDDGWRPGAATPPSLDPQVADAIAEALLAADAPVIIAGGGARGARAALVAVAERFALGVYAAFRRQDVFPNDHPSYRGHLTLGTPPATLRALEAADLVLVVGCRLSEITTQRYRLPRPDQRVVQVDVDEGSVGHTHPVEIGAVADAGAALASLLERSPASPPPRDPSPDHEAFLRASTPPEPEPGALHPAADTWAGSAAAIRCSRRRSYTKRIYGWWISGGWTGGTGPSSSAWPPP